MDIELTARSRTHHIHYSQVNVKEDDQSLRNDENESNAAHRSVLSLSARIVTCCTFSVGAVIFLFGYFFVSNGALIHVGTIDIPLHAVNLLAEVHQNSSHMTTDFHYPNATPTFADLSNISEVPSPVLTSFPTTISSIAPSQQPSIASSKVPSAIPTATASSPLTSLPTTISSITPSQQPSLAFSKVPSAVPTTIASSSFPTIISPPSDSLTSSPVLNIVSVIPSTLPSPVIILEPMAEAEPKSFMSTPMPTVQSHPRGPPPAVLPIPKPVRRPSMPPTLYYYYDDGVNGGISDPATPTALETNIASSTSSTELSHPT